MKPIYLDHNATTPLCPEAAEAMDRCRRDAWANPASQHQPGRRARRILEDAREAIAGMLGARTSGRGADRVIFTSGGTEANNLALCGMAGDEPAQLILSSIEHPSVWGPADWFERRGWRVDRLGVDADGRVMTGQLEALLTEHTRLVSVMLGNHETGVLQPVGELAGICASRGVAIHTDAVQVAGKMSVEFRRLGVQAMSISAHKFHGPGGIGALVIRGNLDVQPIHFGGFQQGGLRPGTQSATLAVGMRAALETWHREADRLENRLRKLRDRFESQLEAEIPSLVIHGRGAMRLPHMSNIAFLGLDRQALMMALDVAGVACSTGSACASGSSELSPVLLSMGLSRRLVDASLRFSLARTTTAGEVDDACRRICRVVKDLRQRKPGPNSPPLPRTVAAKPL